MLESFASQLTLRVVAQRRDDHVEVLAIYPAHGASRCEQALAAVAQQTKTKVTRYEKTAVAGLAARDVESEAGDGHLWMRVVLGKGRVYQLMAFAKGTGRSRAPR